MKINIVSDSTYTVQGHGVHTAFLNMVDGLKQRSDTAVAVNSWSRGYDVTHIHTLGPLGLYHALFGSGKKVISAHVIPESLVGSIKGARLWLPLMRLYLKFFYSRADLICAVSQMVVDSLQNDLKVRAKTVVLYNGIDMQRFAVTEAERMTARNSFKIAADTFVVVGNGQIQPRKRFDVFLDAARQMPQSRFIWIGGAPFGHLSDDYSHLANMVREAPQNVLVTGVIPYDQVKNYLAAADVFWLPSNQENHPMAVLEAAGAGLPILLRDIPEYDDSFGNNALRGTDETFVSLLVRLKEEPEFRNSAIGSSAQIAQRFDVGRIAEQLVGMYAAAAGRQRL